MRKVNLIVALVLCTSLLLSFSACGSKSADKPSAETVSNTETESVTQKVVKTKTPITLEQFENVVKAKGFVVEEAESDIGHYKDNKWYRATLDKPYVQVGFYIYDTVEHAKDYASAVYKNSLSQEGVTTDIGDNYIYVHKVDNGSIYTDYQVDNTYIRFVYGINSFTVIDQIISEFGY